MARIMSCAQTVDAVLDETKIVTRRLGWWEDRNGRRLLQPGDTLSLVRKAMGRKPGEPLERLALVKVTNVTREPLYILDHLEVASEGCTEIVHNHLAKRGIHEPGDEDIALGFISWYCNTFGCNYEDHVTRIEWKYLHPIEPCPSWPPGIEPTIAWDDGIARPVRLIPDHTYRRMQQDAR